MFNTGKALGNAIPLYLVPPANHEGPICLAAIDWQCSRYSIFIGQIVLSLLDDLHFLRPTQVELDGRQWAVQSGWGYTVGGQEY